MKTSVIEVHDMLSVLSVDEVERRIGEVPGIQSVTVNFGAGSATVRYDETRLEVADIKPVVRQRGHESAAPAAPAPAVAKPVAPAGDKQQDKAASGKWLVGFAVAFRAQSGADRFDDRKLSQRIVVATHAQMPVCRRRIAASGV